MLMMERGKKTYQKVDLSALIDDTHEKVGAERRLQRVHPVAAGRQDADVQVHLDALAQHLHLDGGLFAVAAAQLQLLVVP
jgi:hypothetical protein